MVARNGTSCPLARLLRGSEGKGGGGSQGGHRYKQQQVPDNYDPVEVKGCGKGVGEERGSYRDRRRTQQQTLSNHSLIALKSR
jgi:hypothetical protein